MNRPTQLLLVGNGVYLGLFGVIVWVTRPGRRRLIGAMLGGLAVVVVGLGIEASAHRFGWWRYPFEDLAIGPPLIYPAIWAAFSGLALLGWRIARRFGKRGLLTALLLVSVIGTTRDYLVVAALPWLVKIDWSPGIVLLDLALWAGLSALAYYCMRAWSGNARSDKLRGQSL
jgi:hypothetical protein